MTIRLFANAFLLTLSLGLGACASGGDTGQNLADIVRAERGAPAKELPGCKVPADLIGQPHTAIADKKLRNPVRVIFPGSVVSSDRVTNRLNFKVDKKGTITAITCG